MSSKKFRLIIYVLLFLSGATGLLYQIIWTRMLLLIFGTTTHSVVTVLSAFMAGLAIGSFFIGKIADKHKKPLVLYSILELTIGISALATPLLFELITRLYTGYFNAFPATGNLLLMKFLLTSLAILPPTIAMGGTLPLLVRILSQTKNVSRDVAVLYFVNTLGAFVGVLLTGFVFIETFGLRLSLAIGACINIAIGIYIRWIAQSTRYTEDEAESVSQESGSQQITTNTSKRTFALLVFGLSGLLSMGYEVAWIRLLTPTVGTFIYAFTIILSLFLLGIAVGSLLYKVIALFVHSPLLLLGLTQIGIAIGAVLSIIATSSLVTISPLVLQIIVILPATICMGLTFPIISSLVPKRESKAGFVGFAYALNTIGSLLGPILTGFILLRLFGTTRTILLFASVNALLAHFLFLQHTQKKILRKIFAIGSGAIVITLSMLYLSNPLFLYEKSLANNLKKFTKDQYTYRYEEDETAAVLGFSNTSKTDYGLLVDGIGMSVLVDETKLMAHLPLFLHPDPKDMLVIAFGMGTTFRSALSHGVNVDAVELVPSVPKTFSVFYPDADTVRSNPKGRVIIHDGRNYVRMTDKRYDVITVDPPPPVNSAGTTVLYSKEFYEQGKKILRDGGLFTQWLFYDTRVDDFQMLVKSFIDVFPYVSVYQSPRAIGIYLIGSKKPIAFIDDVVQKRLRDPLVSKDLNEWTNWTATSLKNLYFGDRSMLHAFASNAPAVTDNHPRTEYFFLRKKYTQSSIARNEEIIARSKRQ